ncbi:unnamed protein product [Arabidopsis thaliana]|uniref:Transmembrane protein n=4 Tax=Arabidopsis TaxID=3701 RepID=A0A654EKJ0_ARATH|nr:uncharacterized protein AT1G62978 [Arabidopsis thaliana]KAG7650368.1 hypothetical protein ISN45_At01g053280 [Arabidopsis thaliana x Arabidopsis arenosa]KAG7658234.1 hypothetical protein ISN44_As01g052270 [Arabidopsis suecica]AEE34030.1 transmembrane protein [Arabidopsis thaliana]CAA0311108.1 unnamed protein product [Arabidopsis thaliana]VYS49826.1 unnamed protein product [Arabidopsis thaliana]|eukprot:NP_001117538.1 transmembrane protein [Arabidopsis thaliana]
MKGEKIGFNVRNTMKEEYEQVSNGRAFMFVLVCASLRILIILLVSFTF